MVWFQCEDCGENLKKPKLPNHFRVCSAAKLSCIDCGEIFGQQTVQGHNQCISEAEKYGPKGLSKLSNGTPAKSKQDSRPQPDFDINVGLSDRPPWFCSLCNTKATSKQTLLLHADGKKHRAKAKAYHARQQPQPKESAVDKKCAAENACESGQQKEDLPVPSGVTSGVANGEPQSNKKRKREILDAASNGEVIQVEKIDESRIKWKKLITTALKSNPDRTLKMKKLKKLVLKSLKDSGISDDASQIKETLEDKINSSSRFSVDGKYVKLAAKD